MIRPRGLALLAAAAAAILAGCDAGAQPAAKKKSAGTKKMIQLTLLKGDDEVPVTVARRPLHTGSIPPPASTAPGTGPGYTRAFANERQNSRLPWTFGRREWVSKWKLALAPEAAPRFVMAMNDRIVLSGRDWQMVSSAGTPMIGDRLGGGPVVIDQSLRSVFTHYPSAYMSLRRLTDGGEMFQYLPGQGDVYSRIFLTRHRSRMLILGWERNLDPHRNKVAENSRIEILDLGMPPQADEFGFLSSSTPIGELYVGWVGVQMAASEGTLVAAAANELYRFDWDFKFSSIFEGTFEPQALSLDEAGNTYMTLAAGGRNHVWKISPGGEIGFDFALPGGQMLLELPPIVGYNHAVYQLAGQHIYAIGPDGRLRWSRAAEGGLAGAVITADDQLVASEGSCVVSYDSKGDRRKVVCFEGETLTTPPILNEAGDLIVASKSFLHCLGPKT